MITYCITTKRKRPVNYGLQPSMIRCLFHPVFLLLVGIDIINGLVEPPSNVSLHCHNLKNILTWNYNDDAQQGLRFRVDIRAYYNQNAKDFRNVVWVEPSDLQADVSFLSDPEEKYLLKVVAALGSVESKPAPLEGLRFSYNMDTSVDYNCFVDLPSVNVTERPDHRIQWRFQHPCLFYQQKLLCFEKAKRRRSHDANTPFSVFKYEVVVNNQKPHESSCTAAVCEDELPINPAHDKHCVQIKGTLQHTLIKGNQAYCAQTLTTPDHTYIYMVVALLVITAVAGVILLVFYKKTRPSTQNLSTSILRVPHTLEQRTVKPEQESILIVDDEATSATLLLSPSDDQLAVNHVAAPADLDDLRLPIGLPCDVAVAGDDLQEGQVCEENSAYRPGNYLEEGGYESRPEVSGYRGAQDLDRS